MTEPSIRTRRWAWPLAGVVAGALAGGAAVDFGPVPFSAAVAQERPATADLNAPSFADVVERASPAVVNISVTKTARWMPAVNRFRARPPEEAPFRGTPFEDFFERFFEPPNAPGLPPAPRVQGAGSGFVIDADGYIVTNHHVISDADEITVTFHDGRQLEATVVGDDPLTDLALLRVETDEPLPFVTFADSDAVRVGEWVLAIGNPFGLGGTATAGIVSARGRDIESGPYDDYLQIDAPINRGNSGGPVFNAAGEVIGVSTAIFSPNGGNVGIGFAIPSNQAASVVAQLRADGTVERGWLGVQLQTLDPDLAESLGLEEAKGALIAEVLDDTPAARAGLEAGDVVTRFGDRDIASPRDLSLAVAAADPGETVSVEIVRDGATRTIEVELGERADTVASAPGAGPGGQGSLGLQLAPLTDDERARLGISEDVEGALIVGVVPGSPAAEEGLRAGDVIVEVNGRAVTSAADAADALRNARDDGSDILMLVRRGDGQRFVALDRS
ncbi:MAG TPA: DegQ family serine endoprotease [Gammaproteobacteria bacterium]